MELHTLKPAEGSTRDRKRVGRGPGSGLGKTSGRGHKGQGSRSGSRKRRGHEGGQMPLHRRVPKRGFHNLFRKQFQVINLSDLDRCEAGDINIETLRAAGLIKKLYLPVKVLGDGEVQKAFNVKLAAFSKSAVQKIEAAGGKTEVTK
ncbi:MAG: 50S ribosomal protein L15 [bacterium]|nr:50S ribosomal protein L15 [bacterium]